MTERAALVLAAVLALSTSGAAQIATNSALKGLHPSGVVRGPVSARRPALAATPQDVRVAEPSARFERFGQRDGPFTIEHPDNWRAYGADDGFGVSIAPDGGVVATANGRRVMVYGVIVGRYTPFQDAKLWRASLEASTDELVREILTSNPYLRIRDAQPRPNLVGGARSLALALSGRSPITAQEEHVNLVTRRLSDGQALYALSVVPASGYDSMAETFGRMLRTLSVGSAAQRVAQAPSKDARR